MACQIPLCRWACRRSHAAAIVDRTNLYVSMIVNYISIRWISVATCHRFSGSCQQKSISTNINRLFLRAFVAASFCLRFVLKLTKRIRTVNTITVYVPFVYNRIHLSTARDSYFHLNDAWSMLLMSTCDKFVKTNAFLNWNRLEAIQLH